MRLALNAQRELPLIGQGTGSNRTKWFSLMGTPPLRTVMEGALGLPKSFAVLPIDKQLDVLLERSESILGTNDISELGSGKVLGRLLDRFTATADGGGANLAASSPALMILRGF